MFRTAQRHLSKHASKLRSCAWANCPLPTPAPPPLKSCPRPLLCAFLELAYGFLELASTCIGATLDVIVLVRKLDPSPRFDSGLEFFGVELLAAVDRVVPNASTMVSPGLLASPAAAAIDESAKSQKRRQVGCQDGASKRQRKSKVLVRHAVRP